MKYIKYFWYLLKHKWFVMLECFKRGLIIQGLLHDNSKFRPSEFIPYANRFGGNIKKGRNKSGYYKPYDTGDDKFDKAWFLHQKRNPHHWQYWLIPKDNKGVKIIDMPYKYILEMVCDWIGAGIAQGNKDTLRWYHKNKSKLQLSEKTIEHIEYILEDMVLAETWKNMKNYEKTKGNKIK